MESTEATMDLFSSDNWSNQSSNTKDTRLRLDSAEESLHPEFESESVFTRLKDSSGSLFSELNTSRNNFKFTAPSESTMDSTQSQDSKKSSEWNLESSLDSASIPPGQGERVRSNPILSRQTTPDIFTPFSRIQHLLKGDDIKEKIPKRLSDLSPPIEDLQDLLIGETNNTEDKPASDSPDSASQDFHFSLDDDTQCGEYLNTQGFLVSKKPQKPTASKVLFGGSQSGGTQSSMSELLGLCSGKFTKESNSENFFKPIAETDSQGDMDEVLGLCSGKFATTQKTQKESRKEVITNTQQNMDELMELCSGRFPTQATHSADSEGQKPTEECDQENNEDDFDFGDDEDYGKPSKKRNVFSEDEGSEDGDDADSDEEEKEKDFNEMDEEEQALYLMSKKHKKYGKTYQKKKFNKKNFLEEEAELSGSEAGSDENDDGNSDDDVYEEESEVEDLPSDEELQKQVNKVHLKTVMDQDKADLRTFQEMFLRDGDLYSDGRRKRNFRWAGIDDNSQLDLFNAGSDEEDDVVVETEEELQRRKERHEKETYLMENRAKTNEVLDLDESSQSILSRINDTSRSAPGKKIQKKSSKVQTTPPKIVPVKKNPTSLSRRGSFLNLDKQKLSTLSAITANKRNVNVPARNFVFQSVSPSGPKKAKLQRSSSASEAPVAKRPCLERSMSSLPHSSVFSVMQQS